MPSMFVVGLMSNANETQMRQRGTTRGEMSGSLGGVSNAVIWLRGLSADMKIVQMCK
jgi:hypothetical protein